MQAKTLYSKPRKLTVDPRNPTMYSITLRSRIASIASRNTRNSRFSSSSSSSINPPKETLASAQSTAAAADLPPPSASAGAGAPTNSVARAGPARKSWKFLTYGLVGALTGAASSAGYATYAYSCEEIDGMAKGLRAAANYTAPEDAPALEKIQGAAYSTARRVSASTIELYLDLRRQIEEHVQTFAEPTSTKLLPDMHPMEQQQNVFTLVLDLSETLICTDWKRERGWHTFKRPGVDAFLEHLSKFYEIVIYSDEPSMFVDPVVERLDSKQSIRYKLSRDATKYQNGKHYRDLSALNRDPEKIIYVSGHALESTLQPENGVLIKPWKLEADDTALVDLIPFLEYVARHPPRDIRETLKTYDRNSDIGKQFIERFKQHQERAKEQKPRLWRR